LIELFGQVTSKLSSACHTWEGHLAIIDYERNNSARKTSVACVTRYTPIYNSCREEFDSGRINIYAFDVLYAPRTSTGHGYFNQVARCAKTKLDNFIAIALACSTSVIFHYVRVFPFGFPFVSQRLVFNVIDRLRPCT